MNLIVCVDDGCGMAFHHRRQSRDRVLREQILRLTAGDVRLFRRTVRRSAANPRGGGFFGCGGNGRILLCRNYGSGAV